ncbi:hypothetical protein UB46_27550 [Burkholderiaceae bacterium 16]|nr:hypothetical protein UB46_27550 [Burkholderiaceae bacterium 16]
MVVLMPYVVFRRGSTGIPVLMKRTMRMLLTRRLPTVRMMTVGVHILTAFVAHLKHSRSRAAEDGGGGDA